MPVAELIRHVGYPGVLFPTSWRAANDPAPLLSLMSIREKRWQSMSDSGWVLRMSYEHWTDWHRKPEPLHVKTMPYYLSVEWLDGCAWWQRLAYSA